MEKSFKRVLCLMLFFLLLINTLFAGGKKDEEVLPEDENVENTEEMVEEPEETEPVIEEEPEEPEVTKDFIINGREEGKTEFDVNFNVGLGITSFDDVTYQKILVTPEFIVGKFGMGFDFLFHLTYQDNGIQFRREDWVPDPVEFKTIFELYLSKFAYIRYGHEGDPLYIRFGSINNGTLGNGFIMNRYTNTLFLPETRIFGLQFDLDGRLFDFPYIGIESIFSDVTKWVSTGDIIGTRLYGRPFGGLDVPVLQDFQIGTSFVIDLDPFRFADADTLSDAAALSINTDDAKTWALDWDIYQPILNKEKFTFAMFGDVATLNMDAWGEMVGFGGRIVKYITYMGQVRFIGENFIPGYFDASYDLSRSQNYFQLNYLGTTPFYIGYLVSLGTSFFDANFVFNLTIDGPFGEVDNNPDNPLNHPHLLGVFYLNPGVIPVLSFSTSYDKKMIQSFRDIFQSDNLIINAKINCKISAAVISFLYLIRYNENDWSDPEVQSGLEVTIQFF